MCTVCGCGASTAGSIPASSETDAGVLRSIRTIMTVNGMTIRMAMTTCTNTPRFVRQATSRRSGWSVSSGTSSPTTTGWPRAIVPSSLNEGFRLNLMSGPGAGKTTLLVRTIKDIGGTVPIAVIEGDQETSLMPSVRSTGARAVQINTGKGCHLDARMVGDVLPALAPEQRSVVFIENVGNLVCPRCALRQAAEICEHVRGCSVDVDH